MSDKKLQRMRAKGRHVPTGDVRPRASLPRNTTEDEGSQNECQRKK